MSPTLKSTGVVNLSQNLGEKVLGKFKPNVNAIWKRHETVVSKRNRVDIFCYLSTMHERDRQINRPRISNVDRNMRNRLPAMSPKNTSNTVSSVKIDPGRTRVLTLNDLVDRAFGSAGLPVTKEGRAPWIDPIRRQTPWWHHHDPMASRSPGMCVSK